MGNPIQIFSNFIQIYFALATQSAIAWFSLKKIPLRKTFLKLLQKARVRPKTSFDVFVWGRALGVSNLGNYLKMWNDWLK